MPEARPGASAASSLPGNADAGRVGERDALLDEDRVEREIEGARGLGHATPSRLSSFAVLADVLRERHGDVDGLARLRCREEDRHAQGSRELIPLLGLGLARGAAALLFVVVAAGGELLLRRDVLGLAVVLRSEKAGEVPAGRRDGEELGGGAGAIGGIEGADEIRLEGGDEGGAYVGGRGHGGWTIAFAAGSDKGNAGGRALHCATALFYGHVGGRHDRSLPR